MSESQNSSTEQVNNTVSAETQEETAQSPQTNAWFASEAEAEPEAAQKEETTEAPIVSEDAKNDSTEAEQGEDDAEDEHHDAVEDKVGTKKSGFEKRIERFNRRLSEKDAEIEFLRGLAKGQPTAQSQPQEQVSMQMEPKFSDYNDLEAFTKAHTSWGVQQALQQFEINKKVETVKQSWANKEAALKETAKDFDQVMSDLREDYKTDRRAGVEFNNYLVESEVGPQVYYYLGQNRDVLEGILALPTYKQLGELGKLEARFTSGGIGSSAKPKATPPKVSKAPAPITSEKGTAPAPKDFLSIAKDPNASQTAYREARMANRKQRM